MEIRKETITMFRGVASYEVPKESMYMEIYDAVPSKLVIEGCDLVATAAEIKLGKILVKHSKMVLDKEVVAEVLYDVGNGVLIHFLEDDSRDTELPLDMITSLDESDTPKKYAVEFLFGQRYVENVKKLVETIQRFLTVKPVNNAKFNLVAISSGDFYLKSYALRKIEVDVINDYSNAVSDKHEKIVEKLNKINENGILFLHGDPGTGKSFYIRNLIHSLKKRVIYLPPDMSHLISSPEFLPFLTEYPNSILLIEDGENIIGKRENGSGNQAIANLLNLSDGLLSDALSIQIICTFNADKNQIDEALLRKGRLIEILEFKPLEIEKAQKLSDKLGFKNKIVKPSTLAEIYNQDDDVNQIPENKPVGFVFNK